jgi:outer membrane lipoprotein carrier protein
VVCADGADSRGTDKQVVALVKALESRYREAGSMKAAFFERRSEGTRSVQIESGTLYLRRGGLMRWEYDAPEPKLFLVDGKFAWFYVPGDKTVTRARVKESEDARIPILLLAGKARVARVCRRIEMADVRVLAAGNTALRCFPAGSAAEEFREAVFEVDSSARLVRLLVREAGDVETEFQFDRWQENVPLEKALFVFTPPKGTSVVEGESLLSNPGA